MLSYQQTPIKQHCAVPSRPRKKAMPQDEINPLKQVGEDTNLEFSRRYFGHIFREHQAIRRCSNLMRTAGKLVFISMLIALTCHTEPSQALEDEQSLLNRYIDLQREALDLREKKKYKEAEVKYSQLVDVARKYPGHNNQNLATALLGWSQVLGMLDREGDSWKASQEAHKLTSESLQKSGMAGAAKTLDAVYARADAAMKESEAKYGSLNGRDKRLKDLCVKASMRTTQIAAEAYKADYKRYPTSLDVRFKSYFPGGGSDGKTVPEAPKNFLTGKREWPVAVAPGVTVKPSPGQPIYTATPDGRRYSIYGFDQKGKYLIDEKTGKTLVLTNQ